MNFLFRHPIKSTPRQLTVPRGQANFKWLCVSIFSEESDFTTIPGLAERHLLHPLFDSSFEANQLQGTTKLPLLQGFEESLDTAPPVHFVSIPPYHVPVWEVGNADWISSQE